MQRSPKRRRKGGVMKHTPKILAATCGLLLAAPATVRAADLPDPDGKPADMSKPVQVFLIMGQSNTLEMGKVTPDLGEKYPFLFDDAGKPTVCQDVRNVSVMQKRGNMSVYRNEWLTIEKKNKNGIETGIGHVLGNANDAPVMDLKSSIGNRSHGWDLLPPGSERYLAEIADKSGHAAFFPRMDHHRRPTARFRDRRFPTTRRMEWLHPAVGGHRRVRVRVRPRHAACRAVRR